MSKSPAQTGAAKLYHTARADAPFLVVFRDPARMIQTKSGWRAKRIEKFFGPGKLAIAEAYRDTLNETLLTVGAAGIDYGNALRADAIAAKEWLNARGHPSITLRQLAERYTAQIGSCEMARRPIGPEVEAFLLEKECVDGSAPETIKNLRTRLSLWIDLAKIHAVGEITRESVECLRTRAVSPATRRNDLNAVSGFCTWLVSASPPRLDHHPLKGVRRPRVQQGKKATLSTEECARVLTAASGVQRLATLAVMIFAGARPSELEQTRLIYGRHPMVRIEGGKLKGRANRGVPMGPALRAWLATVGNPAQVQPLTRDERQKIGTAAGIAWVPDICRHTFISNRLQLLRNDAEVAREGGTSETIIYRHYHALKAPAEARAWAALRPARAAAALRPPRALAEDRETERGGDREKLTPAPAVPMVEA